MTRKTSRNGIVRLRNLGVIVAVGIICVFVALGCGTNATLRLPWNLVVDGDFRAQNVTAVDDVVAGEDISAGGSITVVSNGNFGGTVTATNVVATNDVTAGGNVSAGDNVNVGGQVIHTPPPPPNPPPPPPASICGNWVLETGEQCDRGNFGNRTCLGYDDFDGGVLLCDANCKIVFSQCTHPIPPPPVEPAPLMSTLQSHNGSDHFHVGDDVKLDFTVSGGVPPYDNRCLFVDGTFATNDNSPAMTFSFKEREARLKLINSPGAGVVTCEVTDARGETTSSSLTIYVN